MKRMIFFVFLSITAQIIVGCAAQWPNVGHTKWQKSTHGGNESTKQYYDSLHIESRQTLPGSFSQGPSLEKEWFPAKDEQVVEKNLPRVEQAPSAVSSVPVTQRSDFSAPPAKVEGGALPPCAGGKCGSWIHQSGKFIWIPNAR